MEAVAVLVLSINHQSDMLTDERNETQVLSLEGRRVLSLCYSSGDADQGNEPELDAQRNSLNRVTAVRLGRDSRQICVKIRLKTVRTLPRKQSGIRSTNAWAISLWSLSVCGLRSRLGGYSDTAKSSYRRSPHERLPAFPAGRRDALRHVAGEGYLSPVPLPYARRSPGLRWELRPFSLTCAGSFRASKS